MKHSLSASLKDWATSSPVIDCSIPESLCFPSSLNRSALVTFVRPEIKGAILAYRNADTLKRLNETERKLKDQKEQAYISLEISNEERENGNQVRVKHSGTFQTPLSGPISDKALLEGQSDIWECPRSVPPIPLGYTAMACILDFKLVELLVLRTSTLEQG